MEVPLDGGGGEGPFEVTTIHHHSLLRLQNEFPWRPRVEWAAVWDLGARGKCRKPKSVPKGVMVRGEKGVACR